MGTPYIQGLLEGFRGRGDEVYQQAIKDDADRRKLESGVFTQLLQSRDPQIRALALQGMYESAQPSPKKGGWRGFLGEIQTSSVFPQIQQIASELVPDEPPAPPGSPQSAAMSTNVPVQQPSTPMQITAGPTGQETISNVPMAPRLEDVMPSEQIRAAGRQAVVPNPIGAHVGPTPAPELIPPANPAEAPQMEQLGQGAAPAGPKRMRPRGTGVPTAEEIFEHNTRYPTQARIEMAQQYLNEEDAKKAIMGILGAPQSVRQFSTPTFAVIDPLYNEPVPVAFDYSSGRFYFTDGTPVPRGAKFVRMSGSAGGGALSSFVRDTPEARSQLIARGADPNVVNAGSPSGYFEYRTDLGGGIIVNPSEYTPPPAFSGTTETFDPTGVVVRGGIQRGGGGVTPLGDAPRTDPAQVQQTAKGLLATVDKLILQAQVGLGGSRKAVTPQQMNTFVVQEAKKLNLPYQTYAELQQAANVAPNITPRQERQEPKAGMTDVDKVRSRALEIMGQRSGRTRPATAPPAPAPAPPARSAGPGGR